MSITTERITPMRIATMIPKKDPDPAPMKNNQSARLTRYSA